MKELFLQIVSEFSQHHNLQIVADITTTVLTGIDVLFRFSFSLTTSVYSGKTLSLFVLHYTQGMPNNFITSLHSGVITVMTHELLTEVICTLIFSSSFCTIAFFTLSWQASVIHVQVLKPAVSHGFVLENQRVLLQQPGIVGITWA